MKWSTFTVNPRVRRIAAHSPDQLPASEYMRQVFWSSGINVPDDAFARLIDEVALEMVELPPGEKAMLSLTLPAEFVIVFERSRITRSSSTSRANRPASARR
jgi:hypothetical protein